MSASTHDTNIEIPLGPFASEADCKAFMKWERWYLSLRAYLHEAAYCDQGDADVMIQFLDAYGLAVEAAAGNPGIVDLLEHMPPEPIGYADRTPAPKLMNRVWDAIEGRPIQFSQENLATAAVALRTRAAAFAQIADSIERGDFVFPTFVSE